VNGFSDKAMGNVKAAVTLGVSVPLCYLAFEHFIKADLEQDAFIRDKLIQVMERNIESETKSAESLNNLAVVTGRMVEKFGDVIAELDDVTDESRALISTIDRVWLQKQNEMEHAGFDEP
jgi:hypothetical protein